jgi:hypothetical protein
LDENHATSLLSDAGVCVADIEQEDFFIQAMINGPKPDLFMDRNGYCDSVGRMA